MRRLLASACFRFAPANFTPVKAVALFLVSTATPDFDSYLAPDGRSCKNIKRWMNVSLTTRTAVRGKLIVKKPDIQQVYQAGSCVLCVFFALKITDGLEGTEFSGGWLTGPLLSMEEIGTILFVLAVVATFVFPRVAAAIGLASSLLSLPLYLFFIAPVPFAQVFASGHEFTVQPAPGFHWHTWPVTGLLALAVTIYLCIRSFAATTRKQITQQG